MKRLLIALALFSVPGVAGAATMPMGAGVAAKPSGTGAASVSSAFAKRCNALASKPVTVLTGGEDGYTVNNTVSFKDLTPLNTPSQEKGFVLGLTKTDSHISLGVDGPALTDTGKAFECIAPEIEVMLRYGPVVIYVASEFAPGSCGYNAILAHELRHLRAYLEHLPTVEAMVRAALSKRFDDWRVYAPVGQARRLLQHELNTGWMPHIKSEMERVELAHAAVDTPQEYARLSKVCQGALQSTIGPLPSDEDK